MKAAASEAVLFIFQLPIMRGLRTGVSMVINKGCELSRMLKKSPSSVLASLRSSTYRREPLGCRNHLRGFSARQDPCKGRTAHTKCGMYLLGPSLAAALLGTRRVSARQGWAGEKSGLFEHLAGLYPNFLNMRTAEWQACHNGFSVVCSATRRLLDSIRESGQARELFAFEQFQRGAAAGRDERHIL